MARAPYWRLSGFYLFYFSTLGGFLPYWGLYLQDKGFNAEQIGELAAMLVGTKIIAPNLWSWIADHTGRGILVIRLVSFLAALAFAGVFIDSKFWWIACVTLVFSFFWNAALPQFEALTLTHIHDDTHRYSRIRIWGSIGFILAALWIGRALDVFGISFLPSMILVLMTGIWLVSQTVPEAVPSHLGDQQKGLLEIIKNPTVIAFLVVCILVQVSHGPYYVFYSIYLEENGYTGTETGQLWALGVLAEVVLFLFIHHLLKRYSLRQILLVSVFLSMLRWLMIGWGVDHLWVLVTAQLLHAASFGSTHVAAIHLIHQYFHGRFHGRGQALYSSASFGVGGVVGSLYSGFLWEGHSPAFVYMIASGISGLALIVTWNWVGKP